ncbi:MAG: hypothetical protein ACKOQM_14405 [Novosphingobium sp.]
MTQLIASKRKRGGTTAALLLCGAVSVLALPSAVLAFASRYDLPQSGTANAAASSGFVPAEVDPRLARSITVRALAKGRSFRFTPAAVPNGMDRSVVTVAVRLNGNGTTSLALRNPESTDAAGSPLRIAPTAYSLGAARGYKSFAQSAAPAAPIRQLDAPDLASYQPKPGVAPSSSRFAPSIALDEREKTGRSPRTFEQSDQQVDVGGSYRVTRNLNVTAGVRYSSDRDRLRPLTDGRQDSQAVYVGTQFRF